MKNIQHLETESIGKLIWKFSFPAVVGMIANASYNLVDRVFVGRGVGTDAISGIVLTYPIVLLVLAFCLLMGIGSAALVSIRLGEKRTLDAERILGNSLTLSILIGILVNVLFISNLDPLLHFFGAKGAIYDYAESYLLITLPGAIFQIAGFALNAIIRGEGNPRIAMFTLIIGAVLNIALDWVFIFAFHWGLEGAAYATVISQIVTALWVLYYFLGGKSLLKFKVRNILPQSEIVKGIFAIGVSPFMMHVASSAIFMLVNKEFLRYGGEISVAAMGIANSVVMFIFMPIFGINQGIQPIIGYNYGARRHKRVKEALLKGMMIATAICTSGFAVAMVFADQLIALFSTNDAELMSVGAYGLRFFVSMLPIVGFQVILGGYFQAVDKAGKAIVLTLTRQIVFIIPLMYIMPKYFGMDGLWSFSPTADLLSSFIAFTFLFIEIKRLNGEIRLSDLSQKTD